MYSRMTLFRQIVKYCTIRSYLYPWTRLALYSPATMYVLTLRLDGLTVHSDKRLATTLEANTLI